MLCWIDDWRGKVHCTPDQIINEINPSKIKNATSKAISAPFVHYHKCISLVPPLYSFFHCYYFHALRGKAFIIKKGVIDILFPFKWYVCVGAMNLTKNVKKFLLYASKNNYRELITLFCLGGQSCLPYSASRLLWGNLLIY